MHSIALQNAFLSNVIKPTYAIDRVKFNPVHTRVQSFAVLFIPSVTDHWNKLSVVILDIDDTKPFENSVFEF